MHAAVKKVVFSLDGVKLKTVRHGPFKVLITTLGGNAKSTHTVTAKVTFRVRHGRHAKTVTKTVRGKISIC